MKNDERVRKEFSKAFGWYERQSQYDYEKKLRLPSWEEIFVHLGKVIAHKENSELEERLDKLERNIRSEIHPNLP